MPRMLWRSGNISVADNGDTAYYAGQGELEYYDDAGGLLNSWTWRISGTDRSGIDFVPVGFGGITIGGVYTPPGEQGPEPWDVVYAQLCDGREDLHPYVSEVLNVGVYGVLEAIEDVFDTSFDRSVEFELRGNNLMISDVDLPDDGLSMNLTRQEWQLLLDGLDVKNTMAGQLYTKLFNLLK